MNVSFAVDFDYSKILSAAERAKKRLYYGFGGYVQKTAKSMIKKGAPGEKSEAGAAPVGHGNELYRSSIFFGVDEGGVSIGGIPLPGTLGEGVPEKIEYGGVENVIIVDKGGKRRTVTIDYQARPAMRLAYDIAVTKFLARLIENSIVP